MVLPLSPCAAKHFPTVNSEISLALRSILAAAVLGTPLIAWATPSVGADTKVDRISIGIGGLFKVGRWTPLTVNLGSRAPARVRLEVEAPDPGRVGRHLPE